MLYYYITFIERRVFPKWTPIYWNYCCRLVFCYFCFRQHLLILPYIIHVTYFPTTGNKLIQGIGSDKRLWFNHSKREQCWSYLFGEKKWYVKISWYYYLIDLLIFCIKKTNKRRLSRDIGRKLEIKYVTVLMAVAPLAITKTRQKKCWKETSSLS